MEFIIGACIFAAGVLIGAALVRSTMEHVFKAGDKEV